MKSNLYIELDGKKTLAQRIETDFKELWKAEGKRVKDIETADLYFKPDENMCYYVVNEKISGKFPVVNEI